MTAPVIAFDESGNTGGNLLDPEQPVFVLASTSLDEDAAREVLGTQQSGEAKFSFLRQARGGRQTILRVLNAPQLSDDTCLVAGFHKPFMAVTMIVDRLVEPLAHRDGVDLYERGGNLALSNLWYFTLPTFLGRQVFDTLVERFVGMVRFPSQRTVQKFYQLLETAYRKHRSAAFAGDLAVLLATRAIANADMSEWDGSDLDPAIPAFVAHASEWTERLGVPFRIIHDASKPIENEQVVLEAMMSATGERVKIGYDRRKMTFPIASSEIELRDSASYPQLQVADILASGAAFTLRATVRGEQDDFTKGIAESRALQGRFMPVWPELKVTPQELGTDETGGTDVLKEVGSYVSKRLGGIPPKGQRRKP